MTKVEQMICGDEELAAVDRGIARLYSNMARTERRNHKSQVEWLGERNRCEDKDCLLNAYDNRIFDIGFASRATRNYSSKGNNGSLAILGVGGGWHVFKVVGLWYSTPESANDAMEFGHFKLTRGKFRRLPEEQACGLEIERLPRDRWALSEIPENKNSVGCGGWNATVTGVYSR